MQDNSRANIKVVVKVRLVGLEWYLLSTAKWFISCAKRILEQQLVQTVQNCPTRWLLAFSLQPYAQIFILQKLDVRSAGRALVKTHLG